MEQLRNLQSIYSLASGRFNQYAGEDFVLPQIFKDQVKEINSNSITYNKYSAVIETRGNQNGVLNIYMPNQWFYIASYFTDFYNELQKYKRYALKTISRDRLRVLNGSSLTETEKNAIRQLDLDEQSKEYLERFITDYSWWYGAKTIDRGDFYVSPLLNSARLVNASQSFVADLCAFLADKDMLVKAIISGDTTTNVITKKELLRQKAAATFMKKAMRITLDRDENFSCIAALNAYRRTPKQLQINEFNIGRDKNQLPTRTDDVDIDILWTYDYQQYVLYLEWTPEMMENRFFPVFNKAYQNKLEVIKDENGEYVLFELNTVPHKKATITLPLQQIFYGAPGTGKSHKIKDDESVKAADEKNLVFRTTFHPDSDYSTFVGAYKPTMRPVPNQYKAVAGKDEEITYSFVPQAFTKAYIEAWKTTDNVFLIIEEINRGNCAQIFGDLFQLLDRNEDGESDYPIYADTDLADFIKIELADKARENAPKDVKEGKKLLLPSNLHIWATMNTSDQSLFPIDSAFKRRWDWNYMKIKDEGKDWILGVKLKDASGEEQQVGWWPFISKVNDIIASMTSSADKQLGYFFCKAGANGVIDEKTFVSKVIFYLWNDVFKDYGFEDESLFTFKEAVDGKEVKRDLTFPDFYDGAGDKVNTVRLTDFVEKVMNWKKTTGENN